jgi:hypothetical protein
MKKGTNGGAALDHCIVTGGKWWEKDENVSTKKKKSNQHENLFQ